MHRKQFVAGVMFQSFQIIVIHDGNLGLSVSTQNRLVNGSQGQKGDLYTVGRHLLDVYDREIHLEKNAAYLYNMSFTLA